MKAIESMTVQEMAEMTDEDIALQVRVELMREGIEYPVPPPVLETVPDFNDVNKVTVWALVVNDTPVAVFANEKDAELVGRIRLLGVEHEWSGQRSRLYVSDSDYRTPRVTRTDVYDRHDLETKKVQVREYDSVRARNKTLMETYYKDCKEADEKRGKVSEVIWSARHMKSKAEAILGTFKEFCSLAQGSNKIAFTFLMKKKTVQELREAVAFDLPDPVWPTLRELFRSEYPAEADNEAVS